MKLKSLSRVQLLATPWIAAYQAPPSMGFLRQEYWIVVSLPNPLRYLHINTSNKAHFLGRLYKIILRFVLLCCILLCWGPHIMSRVPSRPPDLPLEKYICRSEGNRWNWTWNNRLVPNRKKRRSRLYCHPAYLTYMQSTS